MLSGRDPVAARGVAPRRGGRWQPARPAALVLCPTRELAQQVAGDVIDLLRHARAVRVATVVGGLPYTQQLQRLQAADVVVATPGRLLDLQRGGHVQLDGVQHRVLDKADRMLDLGFAEDLAAIHALTAARRQTLMFSATFAPRVQQLAAGIMRAPRQLTLATPQQRHVHIEQRLHWCDDAGHKRRLLEHWLRDEGLQQAIVLAAPRSKATPWPRSCSSRAWRPWRCTVRCLRVRASVACRPCAMGVCRSWWPPTWPRAASTCRPSRTCSTKACR